jgi:hypothetical protein
MTSNRDPSELAEKWEEAWNSHDLDQILAKTYASAFGDSNML